MKMVECMEDETRTCPKGEIGSGITQKNQANPNNGNKGRNKCKWGQRKLRPPSDEEKLASKELPIKKAKRNLSKVKCFNCVNNGHLAKDCPKPLWVRDYIAQGKLILKGGFMVKIGAHESKTSDLLKLNCKINNKIVVYLLDLGTTNSFMIL
jgi:hypothetical protein